MDRLDAMQAFVAVADLQGFAPAARKLGLSPSGVTRLIAALENHLGARLLQRTTRSVTLTDVGARYLERARRILADVEEAEGSAQAERTRPSGWLVVSAPIGFGRRHVSPVMSAYLTRYPEVSGELRLSDFVSFSFFIGFRHVSPCCGAFALTKVCAVGQSEGVKLDSISIDG